MSLPHQYTSKLLIQGSVIHFYQSFRKELSRKQTALVFIHPLGLDSAVWKLQWKYFKKLYPLIAIDLPCFGGSHISKDKKPTPSYYQNIIAEFLRKLDLPSMILVGSSLGGAVALSVYPQLKNKIRGIILVDPLTKEGLDSGFFKPLGTRVNRIALVNRLSRLIAPIAPVKKILQFLSKLTTESSFRILEKKGFYLYLEQFYSNPQAIRNLLEVIRHFDDWSLLENIFPKIDMPVLIVWGRKDGILPLSSAKMLEEKIVRSQLIILPETGHIPYLEKPKEFNRVANIFLKEVLKKNDKNRLLQKIFSFFSYR